MPVYELNGKAPRISPKAFVHPDAVIIGDVTIGESCFIGPGAVIRGDFGPVSLGNGVSFQDNAVIHVSPDSEVVIADNVIVGHASILHDVRIAPGVVVGMGSVLLFHVVCEEDAFIAAGSLVPQEMRVPAGTIVGGNPAKFIKEVSAEQLRRVDDGARLYQELAQSYKATMKRIY